MDATAKCLLALIQTAPGMCAAIISVQPGVLFSTTECKKVSGQYFTAAAAAWETQHCENRAV